MQTREQDRSVRYGTGSGAQLERYDSGDRAPCSPDNAESKHELERYDDEEVATQPWPPPEH
jgi:hypothetical protein